MGYHYANGQAPKRKPETTVDLSPGFTHSTLSPVLLLLLGLMSSAVVMLVNRRSENVATGTAFCSSALLVLLASAHVPVISVIAPRSFCFGDIGALHVVSFALPLAAAVILRLRRGK